MQDKIRAADYIIERLYSKYGIDNIPLLTGNGSLVINDAIAKNKNIVPICVHHEQDAGYFALGYSKYTNKLSVVNPTTGCASTNCITPLLAAHNDHTPILFLSGNVALKQTTKWLRDNNNINIKKLGTQETDIIEIVKYLTKYSVMINDVNSIKYHLDKAIDIALTPPYGPIWIDLPADIGGALINEGDLIEYKKTNAPNRTREFCKLQEIEQLKQELETYERPLILAGQGISLSNSRKEFKQFIEKYRIPVVVSYGGVDLLNYNSEYFVGVCGIKPTRAGNFAIQNCDLLIILGSSLVVPQVGYMGEKFAPKAKKWIVDLETNFNPSIKIDRLINSDLKDFFKYINE